MKDEIKEILDNLIRYRYSDYECKQPEDCLTIEDVWLLLDYITNLQEENKRLKEVNEEHRKLNGNLRTANNTLCEVEEFMYNQAKEYKARIDKAIEMFNNETLNKYYYGMSYEFEINDFKEDILNILQGSDEIVNKEDKKIQKHLVDEIMKVSKTNPEVIIYMESLMEKYKELEQKNIDLSQQLLSKKISDKDVEYKKRLEAEQELDKYKNNIARIQNIYTSMQFSAPENMYVFIDQLGEILEELKGE